MKVVNIQLGPHTDKWTYQDNLLPMYQHFCGHDVWMITTNFSYDESGKGVLVETREYDTDEGIHVIRLMFQKGFDHYKLQIYLDQIKPDYIFFHNMHYFSIWQVVRYIKKNPECVFVIDNHEDEYNHSRKSMNLRGRLLQFAYEINMRFVMPYIDGVFGVTDGRAEYAINHYHAPKEKTDVLLMGVDERKIATLDRVDCREKLCRCLNLNNDELIVITGGKIDKNKKILELMQICKDGNFGRRIKLVVFGSVSEEIKHDFYQLLDTSNNIVYAGFLSEGQIYEMFLSADLGVFPGGHSALWEQAIGCGLPCIFQYRKGMTHVDIGGNCSFFYGEKKADIYEGLKKVIDDEKMYNKMKKISMENGMKSFSYSEIAKKSLSITKNGNKL